MFASTHEPAYTLAVRQTLSADRPVSGSIRWWAVPVSVRHWRTAVLEVASPPELSEIHWPGASKPERWSSVTRIRHPSSGAGPAIARSPPNDTSTPQPAAALASAAARSAASAFAVAPRSRLTPPRTRIVLRSGSRLTVRHPGTDASGRPPGTATPPPTPTGSSAKSRSYPSEIRACPTVGSTSPPVSRAAPSATVTASSSTGPTCTVAPAAALTADSSESSRKREHARSNSATIRSTTARAAASPAASVTATSAVLPNASSVARSSACRMASAHEPPETTPPPPEPPPEPPGEGVGAGEELCGGLGADCVCVWV